MAQVWDVPEASIPKAGKSAFDMLEASGTEVRALIVMGFNVLVSSPDAFAIERRLRALDSLIVVDFFLSETARLADVVLPAAQWAEEEGTMTNLEGRVVARLRAWPPPRGCAHRPRDSRLDCRVARQGQVVSLLGRPGHLRRAAPRQQRRAGGLFGSFS